MSDELRKCRDCAECKPLDQFASAGVIKGKQYHRKLCIQCYSKFKLKRRNKIRNWYRELRKTLRCLDCGLADHRVLEFDHGVETVKCFDVADGVIRGFSVANILNEMSKCDVLCANCHRIRTYERRQGVAEVGLVRGLGPRDAGSNPVTLTV